MDERRKPVCVDRHGKEYFSMPGKPPALSPMDRLELRAWLKAREALGTPKQKARELNIAVGTLYQYIYRIRRES